jgi:hypothetical protein
VIDSCAKGLKRIISKEFLDNKNTTWANVLPEMIEHHNNRPHSSLEGITPNDAIADQKKLMHVMHLNMLKAEQKGFYNDLKTQVR